VKPSRRSHRLKLCSLSLLALVALAAAPAARSQQQPNNEFGLWGAYSFSSPDVIGNPAHMQFGELAFRYARLLHSSRALGIEYTIDVEPVEVAQPEKFVTCQIGSTGIIIITDCPTHEYVYAGGLSPIGWKFNFLPTHQWQPLLATTGGFVASLKPIPREVPGAAQFNFTFDFQAGIQHFNSSRTRAWTFAYKFQHISDANRTNVNPGVNFNMFSVGYSFFK
jgi:hypothetical protein